MCIRDRDRDPAALARTLCERHTGIGADGMIIVKEDPLEMIFYNQDGSRAPMCGNGIRCFAAYCRDQGIEQRAHYAVQTLAGIQQVHVRTETPFQVEIDMGMPKEDRSLIGIASPIWGQKIPLDGGVCVQMCIRDRSHTDHTDNGRRSPARRSHPHSWPHGRFFPGCRC